MLLLLLWAIYKQLFRQQNLTELQVAFKQNLNTKTVILGCIAWLLSIPNFMCETQKWRILMQAFFPVKWSLALKAVLVGTTMAIFTPNRIGEYAGRVLYIPKKYALETITVTMVGSLSQMIVILFFGLISLFFLKAPFFAGQFISQFYFGILAIVVSVVLLCLITIYYKIGGLPTLLNRLNYLKKHLSKLQVLQRYTQKDLVNVQAWAMLKYGIFTTQFVLLLLAFNIPFTFSLFFLVMFIFLIQTLVPTVALLEIGVRSNVALFVIGLLSDNTTGILAASLLLWIINLMLPALLGAVLLFQTKKSPA